MTSAPENKAILYIVATPIGTLEDLSPHAREILSQVSFIACEDTRHSGKLLHYFGIKNELESLHEHNEREKSLGLIKKLIASPTKSAAIISDAGTPCISDPGAPLVKIAHEMGVQIRSIPGPSSMASALAASGFLNKRFLFSGFLERSAREQENEFLLWQNAAPCTALFFESPKRLTDTLENLIRYFGEDIEICVSREISKRFEEHRRGSAAQILSSLQQGEVQGEFAVSVDVPQKNQDQKIDLDEAARQVLRLKQQGIPLKEAIKQVAQHGGLNAKELYKFIVSQDAP